MKIKLKFIYIFLLCNSFYSFSQYIKVTYNSKVFDLKDEYGGYSFDDTILISSQTESVYVIKARDTLFSTDHNTYSQKSDTIGRKIYKNLVDKSCYFKFRLATKKTIKDDSYSIEWIINEGHKIILGYDTQEATAKFRGRKYKAYFCSSLPFQNGPFKFDGLPGLILQVLSDDGCVAITAKEVRLSNDEIVSNPFKDEETTSWVQFKKDYKLLFDKFLSYSSSDGEGSKSRISNRMIECYFDDK